MLLAVELSYLVFANGEAVIGMIGSSNGSERQIVLR